MRRRRRSPISDINVVPYLDVLLVLLVIFMVTAPLFNQGVVNVPEAGEKAPSGSPSSSLEIVLEESGGNYRLIDHNDNSESDGLTEKELKEKLKRKVFLYGNENEKPPIVISADVDLSYGEVMKLLIELREAGHEKIGFSYRSKSQ